MHTIVHTQIMSSSNMTRSSLLEVYTMTVNYQVPIYFYRDRQTDRHTHRHYTVTNILISISYLFPVLVYIFKRLLIVDSKHTEKTFPCSHVLISHCTETNQNHKYNTNAMLFTWNLDRSKLFRLSAFWVNIIGSQQERNALGSRKCVVSQYLCYWCLC